MQEDDMKHRRLLDFRTITIDGDRGFDLLIMSIKADLEHKVPTAGLSPSVSVRGTPISHQRQPLCSAARSGAMGGVRQLEAGCV